jgi:hypothetical protein
MQVHTLPQYRLVVRGHRGPAVSCGKPQFGSRDGDRLEPLSRALILGTFLHTLRGSPQEYVLQISNLAFDHQLLLLWHFATT